MDVDGEMIVVVVGRHYDEKGWYREKKRDGRLRWNGERAPFVISSATDVCGLFICLVCHSKNSYEVFINVVIVSLPISPGRF